MSSPRRCAARRALLCVLAAAALSGCAGAGPPVESAGSAFDQLQTEIFNQHCLGAGCHNAQAQSGNLNLSPGASYDALVGVEPDNPVARDTGMLRVQPFDSANSFLITKLVGPGLGEGTRMPQGMEPLSPADIAMIESWIADGAPRGGTAPPTATLTPVPPTETVTATPVDTATPVNTPTATITVTGTPPPTSTVTVTPSPSPSPSPSPTVAGPTLSEIQSLIFTPTCLDAFCHNSVDRAGELVLEDGQSYSQLVNVVPDNPNARNTGLLRVDPGNVANSFLPIKLEGPPLIQGSRMPLGKPKLPAAEIEMVRRWIENGALND